MTRHEMLGLLRTVHSARASRHSKLDSPDDVPSTGRFRDLSRASLPHYHIIVGVSPENAGQSALLLSVVALSTFPTLRQRCEAPTGGLSLQPDVD